MARAKSSRSSSMRLIPTKQGSMRKRRNQMRTNLLHYTQAAFKKAGK